MKKNEHDFNFDELDERTTKIKTAHLNTVGFQLQRYDKLDGRSFVEGFWVHDPYSDIYPYLVVQVNNNKIISQTAIG